MVIAIILVDTKHLDWDKDDNDDGDCGGCSRDSSNYISLLVDTQHYDDGGNRVITLDS